MVDMLKREHPKPYIDKAIAILSKITNPKILEIGCCRQPFSHNVDTETCFGCLDGHSTYLWARTGWHVDSIDININHVEIASKICSGFNNVIFEVGDAIRISKNIFSLSHDLIFLDAWDVDMLECAEKHLEFYVSIKDKICSNPLILIDDTDLYYDQEKKEYFADPECQSGKGRLLIPQLLKDGYEVVFKGRQTLLRNQ